DIGQGGRADLPPGLGVGRARLGHRGRLYESPVRIGARDATRVVVDAEEVDRLADQREVVRRPVWPCFAEDLAHLLGIATAEYGVEVLAGPVRIPACGRPAGRPPVRRR